MQPMVIYMPHLIQEAMPWHFEKNVEQVEALIVPT